jgi:hypothetical protein
MQLNIMVLFPKELSCLVNEVKPDLSHMTLAEFSLALTCHHVGGDQRNLPATLRSKLKKRSHGVRPMELEFS